MFKKFIPILIIFIFLSNASIASTQDVEKFVDKVADRIIKIVTNKNSSEKTKSSQILKMINDDIYFQPMTTCPGFPDHLPIHQNYLESVQYLCSQRFQFH